MMAINLKGVYAVIHYAVPHMKRRKQGRIIVVSSTAGQRGEAFHTHYGATKGGVISLVKGLATELAPHNILALRRGESEGVLNVTIEFDCAVAASYLEKEESRLELLMSVNSIAACSPMPLSA
jgi:transcriptional accessory protein Tex/SPT6